MSAAAGPAGTPVTAKGPPVRSKALADGPVRRRRYWAHDGYAHIELHPSVQPYVDEESAATIEGDLQAIDGVAWAAYNGALGLVVVKYDQARVNVAGLRAAVGRVEKAVAHPDSARRADDISAPLSQFLSLGADLVGASAGLAGQLLRLPRLPAELTAAVAAVDLLPRGGQRLKELFGANRSDLAETVVASSVAALTQNALSTVADGLSRVALVREDRAQRRAWALRAADLHPDAESTRAARSEPAARPQPLPDGPIERFADRLRTVTLLTAGALLPFSPRRAALAVALGSPRTAHLGRSTFAAQLGRELARRGVVVRDPSALRRLDRIDTVIIDSRTVVTGRTIISEVAAARGGVEEARERADGLLGRSGAHDGWALVPVAELDRPPPARLVRRVDGAGGAVLALTRDGALVALLRVEAELDPLATPLIEAARRVGRVVLAGASAEVAERLGVGDRVDQVSGGARLTAAVLGQQRSGRVVALIAAGNDAALAAADLGLGVLGLPGRRPPWGAHMLCGPGLESAWMILEAAAASRRVARRSVRAALLGTVAGALLAAADRTPRAGSTALAARGVAALAAIAGGWWTARELARRPTPAPENLVPWHSLTIDEVCRLVETTPAGLTEDKARRRRSTMGPQVEADGQRGILASTVSELDTPLTAPLAVGAGVSAATGSVADAVLVLSVLLANAGLAAVQDITAGRAMRRLLAAGSLQARTLRDGNARVISAEELVVGDVVLLEPGDAVPADCRLLTATGLEMDESALTGESTPVAKTEEPVTAPAVADRTSMVYSGTTVAAGTATAIVVAVGAATEAGRSERATFEDAPTTGVQARLSQMASASVPVSLAAAVAMLLGGVVRGQFSQSLNQSVALAVAAIPEGLPFIATAAQLSAARRLARRGLLVRNSKAMEALGRVDVICFDKTGTLTEGRIALRAVSDGASHVSLDAESLPPRLRSIVAAALRASPVPNGEGGFPHPTDRAVVDGGQSVNSRTEDDEAGWRMLRELPFESGRGFHAVLGRSDRHHLISVKGAPEVVIPRCVAWRRGSRTHRLTNADREAIDAEVDRLADRGLRVLAVAERIASPRPELDDQRVDALQLCGLLGLADTTRASSAEAVQQLRRAGVTVVMLTGDHPSTAAAIAAELNLLDGGTVVTGPELDEAGDTLDALVSKAAVFARVSPAHKVAVVRALRRAGRVVAVTGDGANDAPAIRLADVGIAVGGHGTTAARQAADVLVLDGRLETIADGVLAGRAMWAAVREALALLLGGNMGEVLFTVGSSMISANPPLNTRQILFVNLMTDLLPALTVASRTPRWVSPESLAREGPETSLGGPLTQQVARRAIATSLATTGGWIAARLTGTPARASSVAMAALVTAQLAQTVVASNGDPAVLAATGLSLAAMVGAVQTPGVSHFFGSRPLGPVGWGIVTAAGGVAAAIGAMPDRWLPNMSGLIERAQEPLAMLRRLTSSQSSEAARPER